MLLFQPERILLTGNSAVGSVFLLFRKSLWDKDLRQVDYFIVYKIFGKIN